MRLLLRLWVWRMAHLLIAARRMGMFWSSSNPVLEEVAELHMLFEVVGHAQEHDREPFVNLGLSELSVVDSLLEVCIGMLLRVSFQITLVNP